MSIQLPILCCLRCGHTWVPRQTKPPQVCPGCNSPYWDKPRVLKYKNKKVKP